MPTRRPPSLSTEQIDHVRAELEAGRTPMVWFTPVAVGVDAGRSAKVVSLTEPYEGDFIQVRPTGSHDTLSFSTSELTMDKPARRPKPPAPAPAPPAAQPEPVIGELLVVRERPTPRKPLAAKPADPPQPAPEAKRPARGRARQPAPITVTLSSTPDGEWTVEVQAGSKRTVRPQPVSAGSVAAAAKALGGDIEQAIDGAITAAREQQQARVAQLEAELETARQALAELTD